MSLSPCLVTWPFVNAYCIFALHVSASLHSIYDETLGKMQSPEVPIYQIFLSFEEREVNACF